jgi:hypothetical protein
MVIPELLFEFCYRVYIGHHENVFKLTFFGSVVVIVRVALLIVDHLWFGVVAKHFYLLKFKLGLYFYTIASVVGIFVFTINEMSLTGFTTDI